VSKQFFCAQCGTKLEVKRKAIPQQGVVIDLVEPHTCGKKGEEFDLINLDTPKSPAEEMKIEKMFEGFDFVQKLNKATEVETPGEPGDQRPKSARREELVTSSAPVGVLDIARNSTPSTPEREDLDE